MNRRGFMGLFGAVAATGPKAAVKVAADMTKLDLSGVGLLGALVESEEERKNYGIPIGSNDTGWAADKLAKMALKTAMEIQRSAKHYHIGSLDADTHALRSVSLANKIRISQRKQYLLDQERETNYLKRIVAGLE